MPARPASDAAPGAAVPDATVSAAETATPRARDTHRQQDSERIGHRMKLAILFWCYKRPEICEDRLRSLRRDNPSTPIFALYGGEPVDAPAWRARLGPLVDDFYVFDGEPPASSERFQTEFRGGAYWKYTFGDLLIAAWYRDRGVDLDWDTVVIVQWDMLVYGSVDRVFRCLQPGQVLFSGLRPVREVASTWVWTTHPKDRADYDAFVGHLRERFGFDGEPMSCVAIVMCFPRAFLEHLARIERPELGFLEYRLPTYAKVFGIPFCTDHPFKPWWGAVERFKLTSTLRARPLEIWAPVLAANLLRSDGARVFHPYWRRTPRGAVRWTLALLDAVPRILVTGAAIAVQGAWQSLRRRRRRQTAPARA